MEQYLYRLIHGTAFMKYFALNAMYAIWHIIKALVMYSNNVKLYYYEVKIYIML